MMTQLCEHGPECQWCHPGDGGTDPAETVGFISQVCTTFHCTQCGAAGTHRGTWGEHHTLPMGWRVRDVVPSYVLRRQTDHIFACGIECAKVLDTKYPAPSHPIWFREP